MRVYQLRNGNLAIVRLIDGNMIAELSDLDRQDNRPVEVIDCNHPSYRLWLQFAKPASDELEAKYGGDRP